MAVYVIGLVLVTAAIELVIAFFIAAHSTHVPSSTSSFWWVYLGALVILVTSGGVLVARGLFELRGGAGAPPGGSSRGPSSELPGGPR